MQRTIKEFLPHIVVILLFVIASLAYFSPVLQGKKIFQSDIIQYTGMAKQQNDFRKVNDEETYWTDSAFAGMPTYQLGAKYPHNYIKKLDLSLRFLPRPADYLFLYFIGIYILLLILKIDYKLAFIGALAFGFSTYLIIILGVGHNAKAHAIAYMPLVLSGVLLTFRGKYLYGFLLTTIALGLELVANHFQMTYYLMLLIICVGIAYLIDAYRNKLVPQYFKSLAVMVMAVGIALGLNATNIMATKEYAQVSTRGNSELTIQADGSDKAANSGLEYDYITEYSYGKLETFNLFIPRFMGGGSGDSFENESKAVDHLFRQGLTPEQVGQVMNQVPVYWGDQPIVAAPAYVGAVVIFLAILALFLVKGRLRWWLISAFFLSLFLSWGRNFSIITELFIDYIPLYNKFRAVSSIQVIIELILPILAVLGLNKYFKNDLKFEDRKKMLLYTTGIVGGITLIFILFKSSLFNFTSPYDKYFIDELGMPFVDAVREDRMALFTSDAIRSLVFVLLAAATLYFYNKNKIKQTAAIAILATLIVIDLVGVDRRYVNNEDFVQARIMESPFLENGADLEIKKDSEHFRVYDITTDAFSSGRTSYFHNALGGYHAAKPRRIQDLYDFYISKGDIGLLNMLNVKYIIVEGQNGGAVAQRNPYTNGNAWFVENVLFAENDNEEILLLDSLNTKETVVVQSKFKSHLPLEEIKRDSTAVIDLVSYKPNHLVYESTTQSPQLAVFSESYYKDGWHAFINDEPADYIRVNYALRGMKVPIGNNKIEFKFEPQVIKTGSTVALSTSILFLLLIIGGLFFNFKNKKRTNPH